MVTGPISGRTTTLNDLTTNTSVIQHDHTVTTGPLPTDKYRTRLFMDPQNTFSLAANIGFGHHPTTGRIA